MSFYLSFNQILKSNTPEPQIEPKTQTFFNTESDGTKILSFDAGQDLLALIMTKDGTTGNTTIDNFRNHFIRTTKKHDINELEQFIHAVREDLESGGIEFIHTATDGWSRDFPNSSNLVDDVKKQLNNFEKFIQYAIENKLTVKHLYA